MLIGQLVLHPGSEYETRGTHMLAHILVMCGKKYSCAFKIHCCSILTVDQVEPLPYANTRMPFWSCIFSKIGSVQEWTTFITKSVQSWIYLVAVEKLPWLRDKIWAEAWEQGYGNPSHTWTVGVLVITRSMNQTLQFLICNMSWAGTDLRIYFPCIYLPSP